MGSMVDSSCVLCRRIAESRNHLFFDCQFSKKVVEVVTQFLRVRGMPTIWHLLISWFDGLKANAVRTRMLAAAISMAALNPCNGCLPTSLNEITFVQKKFDQKAKVEQGDGRGAMVVLESVYLNRRLIR
ncbi:hypothetical protein QQ045_023099 [Rhodiola kirilowii]